MKIYFDNREGRDEPTYITIFCDGEYFGKIKVCENEVNAIVIPKEKKVLRVSTVTFSHPSVEDVYEYDDEDEDEFEDDYKTCFQDYMDKEYIEKLDLPFTKEPQGEREAGVNLYLKYIFDVEIELENIDEDIVFYQATFVPEGAECVLRYNVRKYVSGEQVPIRYVRRESNGMIFKYRLKTVICTGVATVAALPVFKMGLHIYNNPEKFVPFERLGIVMISLGILSLCFATPMFFIGLTGLATSPEKRIKSEYYLDSDGNWSSSEK